MSRPYIDRVAPASDPGAAATVVGGGPAGLMAAETLARAGLVVTVYEHMASVGRKLQLAGRSGLNITHSEPIDDFLARYGPRRARLDTAVRAFGPTELRAWCAALGEPTFVGSSGRVFPASFRATPLLRAWLARLRDLGVVIETRHRWLGWGSTPGGAADPRVVRFSRADGTAIEVANDVTLLALGGASWPRVGSDGAWVEPLQRAGVDVRTLRAANCGVVIGWSERFVERFAGTPLKNVAIGVAGDWVRGDAMITIAGMESGPVYAHSAAIRERCDRDGRCIIEVDLHPDLTVAEVAARLERRRPKDSLATSLRRAIGLPPVAAALLRESTANALPSSADELAALVKACPLVVEALMPMARAISSAGGVALDEVGDGFMLRRLAGTFIAGEMLDWDAPTGGYLLQATFSTAVAAAQGAIAWLDT